MIEKRKNNYILDFVRILSALAIFISHSGYIFNEYEIIRYGLYGVDFFFVISGYFIFTSLERNESYKQYIGRRLCRILPAYFIVVIFTAIWKSLILRDMPVDYMGIGWLRYFLCLHTIIPSNDFIWNNIFGLWTIPCFVFFYIAAPLIKRVINNSIHRVAILTLICMGWCAISQKVLGVLFETILPFGIDKLDVLIGSSPLNNLYLFCPGIMAYYIVKNKNTAGIGMLDIGLILMIAQIINIDKLCWACYMALIVIGSEMYISTSNKEISNQIIKTLLSFTKYIARVSFTFYLCHMLILDVVGHYYYSQTLSKLISIITIVVSTICLDLFSTLIVDKYIGKKEGKNV